MNNSFNYQVRLHDASGDVSKRWFVYYNFNYPGSKFCKRFKIYGELSKYKDLATRYKAANSLVNMWQEKLKKGFNPFDLIQSEQTNEFPEETLISRLYKLNDEQKRSMRKKSWETYRSCINVFKKYLIVNRIQHIKPVDFDKDRMLHFLEWLYDKRKATNTTRNKYRSFLILYLKTLKVNNSFEEVKKVKEFRRGKLPFKNFMRERLKAIISDKDSQLWLACEFLYYTFIRPNELRYLKISDIDFDNLKIVIHSTNSKNGKTQTVDIPDVFKDKLVLSGLMNYPLDWYVFSDKRKPGPNILGRDNLSKRHLEFLKENGYNASYCFYSWKHTGNVQAVKGGMNLKDIQGQNRHSQLNTTDIYLTNMGAYENERIRKQFPPI